MLVAGAVVPLATVAGAWLLFGALVAATRIAMLAPGLGTRPRAAFLASAAAILGLAATSARARTAAARALAWLRTPDDDEPAAERTHPPTATPLAVGAAIAVSTAIIHSPVIGRLATHYHAAGDSDQQIGLIHAVSEAMRAGSVLPRHLPGVVAPIGFDLWASDGYLPLYAGGLLALVVSPLLSYNLLLLGATAFNAWVGTVLARLYGRAPIVMALAGISLATAPAVIIRYGGHLQLVWVGLVGLLFGAGVADGRAGVRPVRLGLLLAASIATSGYFVVIGGLLYAVALLCGPRPVARLAVLRSLLVAGAVGALLASPLVLARVAHDRAESDAGGSAVYETAFENDRAGYSADMAELVTPQPMLRFGIADDVTLRTDSQEATGEGWIHPGWLAVLALGAIVVVPGRARIAIAAGAVGSLVLAWGPVPRLWGYEWVLPASDHAGFLPVALFRHLPVADAIRVPGRFGFGLAVVGAAAIGLAGRELDRARLRGATAAAVATAALALLVLNTGTWPVAERPDAEVRAVLSTARSTASEGDGLLVAPADCSGPEVAYLHLQVYHQLPQVGCTAPFLALPWFSEMDPYFDSAGLAALRCHPEALGWYRPAGYDPATALIDSDFDDLRADLGIRFVLVDLSVALGPSCPDFAGRALGVLEPHVVASTDRWWLVDLAADDPPG